MLIASDQFRIVVGLGKSGMSLVRHLARRGLPFAVVDTRANPPELATLKAEYRFDGADRKVFYDVRDDRYRKLNQLFGASMVVHF